MANPTTPDAIAAWAEHQAAPTSHRKPTKRLTAEEIGILLKLKRDGLTQVQIAQRLDCDQSAVSRWLNTLQDTTQTAKSYLAGSALRMARNVVHKGQARDHVAALKGLGVLEETHAQGLTVHINGMALAGIRPSYAKGEAIEGEVLSPPLLTDASEGVQNP